MGRMCGSGYGCGFFSGSGSACVRMCFHSRFVRHCRQSLSTTKLFGTAACVVLALTVHGAHGVCEWGYPQVAPSKGIVPPAALHSMVAELQAHADPQSGGFVAVATVGDEVVYSGECATVRRGLRTVLGPLLTVPPPQPGLASRRRPSRGCRPPPPSPFSASGL